MDMERIVAAAALTTQAYQTGMEQGARFERLKFEAVILAYDKALRDKHVVIPSYLHAAIEHARSELAKQNIAAEAGIQRDKALRDQGRPEHDMTTTGSRLQAGA